jgi:alpha-tubulin suppressor-like RCC1 family protein
MKRFSLDRVLSLCVSAIVAACSSGDRLAAPSLRPEFAISDAVHEGGTPGFYFLPPMVPQPTVSGTFDGDIATLNPQIAICDVSNGPDNNCGDPGGTPAVVVLTTTTTPAITLDPTTPQYQVLWDTKGAGFVAGGTYRAHIIAGAAGSRRQLGFADVLLATTPGQVKHLETGDLIVLRDGRTLAVDFRIESHIPGSVVLSVATPSVATGSNDLITAAIGDLHGAVLAGATAVWSVSTTPPTGVADGTEPLTPTVGQTSGAGTTTTSFKAGSTGGLARITAASGGLMATATLSVSSGLTFSTVAAGLAHVCGLTPSGAAYCWGANGNGQLGDGTMIDRSSPVAVLGGLTFVQLTAGYWHTCGVTTTGAAYCWGQRLYGKLADGTSATDPGPNPPNQLSPVPVLGGLTFAALSAKVEGTCGVTTSGALYCWGAAPGLSVQVGLPAAVGGGLSFASVSIGANHACGVTTSGAAYCWGFEYWGEIGDGTDNPGNPTYRANPVAVVGGLNFAGVSAGSFRTCGLTTGGAAYCWGFNDNSGPLGVGAPSPIDRSTPGPLPVLGGLTFATVSTGTEEPFTCGLTIGGAAYCWGINSFAELGDGTLTPRASPVAVSGGLTFATLSVGGSVTCGVTLGGFAYCWGNDSNGQLGAPTVSGVSVVPVKVAGQP